MEDKEDALDLREEMRGDRAVQISKKEINELMTELLDTLGNDEETEPVRMHLSQHISQKEAKKPQFKIPQICQSSTDKVGALTIHNFFIILVQIYLILVRKGTSEF